MTQTQQPSALAKRFDDMVERTAKVLQGTAHGYYSVNGSAQHHRPLSDVDELSPQMTTWVMINNLRRFVHTASFSFAEVLALRVAFSLNEPDTSHPAVSHFNKLEQATELLQEWHMYSQLMGFTGEYPSSG